MMVKVKILSFTLRLRCRIYDWMILLVD